MLIELKGIEKHFKVGKMSEPVKILRGIDLEVEKGEMIAVKGSSGAGKSTLLNIIGCLDRATKGTYLLDGEDITLASSRLSQIRNKKLGFVMQHFSLIEDDSVLMNVGVPLLFSKTKVSSIDSKALEQLQKLGIAQLAKQKVAVLSGGEKQRVAIARALINEPDIILADEPTGALDTANSMMVMDILKQLNREGKTIIIVTHEDFVAKSCSRILTISDGKIF